MPFGSGIKRQGAGRETTVRNLRTQEPRRKPLGL